jgi:hypothetical protein
MVMDDSRPHPQFRRSSTAVIGVYGRGMTQKTGAGLLLMTLFVVGCANGGASSPSSSAEPTVQQSPSAMASPNPAVGCLAAPPDVEALIEFQDGTRDDPAGCFGDAPLTFDASWTGGGVADCPMAPEPAWLACSAFSLGLVGETRKVGAPALFVAVDPSLSSLPDAGTDVSITGHFDDPAAQTCHETVLGGQAESLAPAADTIEQCRSVLVITAATPLES